jgi:preprotein translocase subunit SecA
MFEELGGTIREEVVVTLFHAQLAPEDAPELQYSEPAGDGSMTFQHESLAGADAIAAAGLGGEAVATAAPAIATQRVASEHEKVGRNDPCWCGSGKKFKRCHGA